MQEFLGVWMRLIPGKDLPRETQGNSRNWKDPRKNTNEPGLENAQRIYRLETLSMDNLSVEAVTDLPKWLQ